MVFLLEVLEFIFQDIWHFFGTAILLEIIFGGIRSLVINKISQKKLKEKVEENVVMGIIIKDEMALAMMEMKEFENLIDYVEELEQMLEEAKLVNKYLKEMLETPEEEFIEMPTNMSVKEYKKWRKEMDI